MKQSTAANTAIALLTIGIALYLSAHLTALNPGSGIAAHAVRRANVVPGLLSGFSVLMFACSLWLAGYAYPVAKRKSVAVFALVTIPWLLILLTSLVQSISRGKLF